MNHHVLLIDDDHATLHMLRQSIGDYPIVLSAEQQYQHALARLHSQAFDAALLAIDGNANDGLVLLEKAHSLIPTLPLIALAARATVDLTVRAFRTGATDFLSKPVCAAEALSALERKLSSSSPHAIGSTTNVSPWHVATEVPSPTFSGGMMSDVRRRGLQFAQTDSPILAIGELGVGKEMLLNWIHSLSDRRFNPIVKVYCDAIHESQFCEMLFGRGNGESSLEQRRGFLDRAGNGTVILHNIAALSEASQNVVAEAYASRTYTPVDSDEIIPIRARLAATIVDRTQGSTSLDVLTPLIRKIFAGSEMPIPPLRKRVDNLRPLVHALNYETGRDPTLRSRWGSLVFSEPALAILESHCWPGNVDELRNFIRRLFVFMERPRIEESDVTDLLIPGPRRREPAAISVSMTGDYRMISRAIVTEAIQRAHGNKSAAARSLGLHRKTLYRIIEGGMKQEHHKNRN